MAEQTGRTGKCTNFGNCTLADTGADVSIPEGAAPVCTECGRGLMVSQPGKDRSKLIGGVIALVVLAAIAVAAMTFLWDYLMPAAAPEPPAVAEPMEPPPPRTESVLPAPPQAEPVLPPPQAEPGPPPPPAAAVDPNMVKLADFFIDRTEVSVGDYRSAFPGYRSPKGFTDDLPVVDITWENAKRFAEKSGKRLCRESEWLFALGDELSDPAKAALGGSTMDKPRSVSDDRDENSHGLLNMVGNVSEWVDSGTEEAAFLGGYWYWDREGRPLADLKRVNRLGTKGTYHHYIGFRTCRDADPAAN
ncbi:SUMF1/EgtB/PvdO family nonheme iron enzyme [uncultured Lamprocystis sp.]|uniref:formylglycine-generating enzyme family protein n=1 Tax=uncultured Lamprocystis sp. TaxID=543132 RepID=UPI0025E80CA4|nr:SUMF1/EgtB/PvdO family nonheme iron enzyme [uncultured Lamprocystis sp.]